MSSNIIEVSSNSYTFVTIGNDVLAPFETKSIELEGLTVRELRNVRYLNQLKTIIITPANRSILNRTLYELAGLMVEAEAGEGGAVTSVNGETGNVVVNADSIGVVKVTDLKDKVVEALPGIDTVVATANSTKTKTDTLDTLAVKYVDATKKSITLSTAKITGLSDATLSTTSTDAVTGKQLTTTNTNVTALTTRVTTAEGKVSTLESKASTLETDVASAKTSITTLTSTKADKTAVASTDVITEGTKNLYYTDARANSAKVTVTSGTNAAVVSGETLTICISKLQAQITDLKTRLASLETPAT